MRREEFTANWSKFKGKILGKWNKFTEEELLQINGKYDHFMGLLQKKYSFSREQAEKEMANWNPGFETTGPTAHEAPKTHDKPQHKEKHRKAG